MEFAQPERLAFLLLLPLLYLLSLPPRPRRSKVTAHLAQWLEARRKLSRRPVRFRWWRFLLLAGAFFAAVLAHTGPRLPGSSGSTELVILVDTSASMAARRPGQATAFEQARESVVELLAAVPGHIDLRLGLCGAEIEVVRGDRDALRRALATTVPGGVGGVDFAYLVAELRSPTTAVLTVTDGLGPTRSPPAGALRLFGADLGNAAITGCTIEDAWPLPEIVVTIRLHNGITTAPQRTFELECGGGIDGIVRRSLAVAAGRSDQVRFEFRRGVGGELRIAIARSAVPPGTMSAHRDALPLDDAVILELPPPPRPEIVVRADHGEPSEALLVGAQTLADECGGVVRVGGDASRAGFLLVQGGEMAAPPARVRMISFGTRFTAGARPRSPGPRILDWNRTHPVTAGLDLSELRISRALDWPADAGFPGDEDTVLVTGERGALVVLRGGRDWAAVHLAFGLEDSNLFKLAAFPQFLRRCFAASYGRKALARVNAAALLDPAESNLVAQAPGEERSLPAFARRSQGLAVPLLVLALLMLAIRVYV